VSPAQTQLVEAHMELLDACVRKFCRRLPPHVDRDEMRSAAQLALVQCAQRFDGSRGLFSSFCWRRMVGAMLDTLRELDPNGRRARETGGRLLFRRDGEGVMGELIELRSLNAPSALDETAELGDTLGSVDEQFAYIETFNDLHAALTGLPERQRQIVLRIAAGERMAAIGVDLGITESRVSQLFSKALRKIAPRMAA